MNHQDQPLSSFCVHEDNLGCHSSDTIYPVLRQRLVGLKFVSETGCQWAPRILPLFRKTPIWCHEMWIFLLSLMGTETVLALCRPALACLQLCIHAFLFSFLVSSSWLALKSSHLRPTRLEMSVPACSAAWRFSLAVWQCHLNFLVRTLSCICYITALIFALTKKMVIYFVLNNIHP